MTIITTEDKRRKFLSDLKSLSYWNKRIIDVNLELIAIAAKLYEVQAVNFERIPTTTHVSITGMLMKEEELIAERKEYESYFNKCEIVLRQLSPEVYEYLIYSYVVPGRVKSQNQIARQFNISRTGLQNQVNRELQAIF